MTSNELPKTGNTEPIHVMDQLVAQERSAGVPVISTGDIQPIRGKGALPLKGMPRALIGNVEPVHVIKEFVEGERKKGVPVISTGDIKP